LEERRYAISVALLLLTLLLSLLTSGAFHPQQLEFSARVESRILSDPRFLESLAKELEKIASESPVVRLLKENPGRVAVLEVRVTITNNAWYSELYVAGSHCVDYIKEAVTKLRWVKEDALAFAHILIRPIKGEVYGGRGECSGVLDIRALRWDESLQNVYYYIILRPESGEPFEAELLIRALLCRSASPGGCKWHDLAVIKVNW